MSHPPMTAVRAAHDDMPANERFTLPPNRPEETDETFHQLGTIGRAASLLLGLTVVTHLLSTLADWHTYHVVRDYLGGKPNVDDSELNAADTIARLTSIPNVAISVAAAVVFVLWLWRARLNSEVFCKADHRHGHGWVLSAWIIPGPNLIYPKHIVDDVMAASDKRTPAGTEDLSRHKRSPLTAAWWICWVGAMLLDVVLRRVLMWVDPTVGSLRVTALSASVALVLTVLSAILAIFMIRRITKMQQKRPWIAWWDLEEPEFGGNPIARLERVRETSVYEQQPMYAGAGVGAGTGAGEPRYAAAAYDEPSRDEPSYSEPAYEKPEPAYPAASLRSVPDPKPSWRRSSEPPNRYDDPAPTLVGLPQLPSIPAIPEPEPDKPAWTPFASVVQEWQHEDDIDESGEQQRLDVPTAPTQSVWPATTDKPYPNDREPQGWPGSPLNRSGDYLNPPAPIPSPPTPPLTLVPEPSYDGYRDESAASREPSESDYSYDRYQSYRSELESYGDRSYGQGSSVDQPTSRFDSPLDRPSSLSQGSPFDRGPSDGRYDQGSYGGSYSDPPPSYEPPASFDRSAANQPGRYEQPTSQQNGRAEQAPPVDRGRKADRPSRFRPVPPDSEPNRPAQGPGQRFDPSARRESPSPRPDQAPRLDQAPKVERPPRLDQAPRLEQAPQLPQAPRLDQAPTFGQPPRRNQAPSFDQPSSYGRGPVQPPVQQPPVQQPPAPKPAEPETGPYESPYSSSYQSSYQPSYTDNDSDYTTADLLRSFASEPDRPRIERPRRAAPQPEPPRDSSYGLPSYGYGDSYGSDSSYTTGSHAALPSGDDDLPSARDSFAEVDEDDTGSRPRTHPRRRWSV